MLPFSALDVRKRVAESCLGDSVRIIVDCRGQIGPVRELYQLNPEVMGE